jgi:hypothetical protein
LQHKCKDFHLFFSYPLKRLVDVQIPSIRSTLP